MVLGMVFVLPFTELNTMIDAHHPSVKKAVSWEIGTFREPVMQHDIVDFSLELEVRKAAIESGAVGNCPISDVIDGISGKWDLFLLTALAERPRRFGELRRLFPDISQRMLTQTLRKIQPDASGDLVVWTRALVAAVGRDELPGCARGSRRVRHRTNGSAPGLNPRRSYPSTVTPARGQRYRLIYVTRNVSMMFVGQF
jgi:hypothetical protein